MLMLNSKVRMHLLSLWLPAVLLVGCGGGGGGSRAVAPESPAPTPAPATVDINGQVMLGLAKSLEVRVSGDGSFEPVIGVTDEFGVFGPLVISESYSGPLRLEAVPDSASVFVCDAPLGCMTDSGEQRSFGEDVPLAATLQLYLADASQALDGVSITPFSTAAAARADALGAFGPSFIQRANDEMDAQLEDLFGLLLDNGELQMPLPFYRYQLLDLTDSSIEESLVEQARVELLLALLGASLFSAGEAPTLTGALSVEAFLSQFAAGFVPDGALPLTSPNPAVMSLEKLSSGLLIASRTLDQNRSNGGVIRGALAPLSLYALSDSVYNTIAETDKIVNTEPAAFRVTDAELGITPSLSVPLALELGAALNLQSLSVRSDDPRVQASTRQSGQSVVLDLTVDPAAVETPISERVIFRVVVSSSETDIRSLFLDVLAIFDVAGLRALPGGVYSGFERDRITLTGGSNQPQIPVSFAWRQVSGPVAQIEDADQASPIITLPTLDADAELVMELLVTNEFGDSATSQTTIAIASYANLVDINVDDTQLNSCIADLAANSVFQDVGAVLALDCSGRNIKSLAGIGELRLLQSLNLAGLDLLGSLRPLVGLAELRNLDISDQRFLLCTQINVLRGANPNLTVVGGDSCKQQVSVNLLGYGFDAQLDSARQRLFVSVPQRRQILVVSTENYRVVDTIDTPGKPRGMSLSLDGTRLFAAMGEANSVLVLDLSNLSTQVVSLGRFAGSPHTIDVVEVEQDRLFVTTGDERRSAYVVQVRLDAANSVSRIGTGRSSRREPAVLASPNGDFAYLLESDLYKLDLADPAAPVIGRAFSVGNFNGEMVLNADGSRLALGSGQVLRTASLVEDSSRRNEGAVAVGLAPDFYYVAQTDFFSTNGDLLMYRFDDGSLVTTIDTNCFGPSEAPRGLSVIGADDSDFAWIVGDHLCGVASVDASLLDPTPELRVQDPVLEACVRSSARAAGVFDAVALTNLDCSGGGTVKTLAGLERFSGLVSLSLAGSEVMDIRPIQNLTALESISFVDDQKLADITEILRFNLSEVDFTGSHRVSCAQLQTLRDNGVSVTSDSCLTVDRFELNGLGHAVIQNLAGTSLYVSVPSTNTIFELDSTSLVETRRLQLSESPRGLSLSPDQSTLAVALAEVGSIALIDLATEAVEIISVQPQLDNLLTWELAFLSDQRLVVLGNPASGGSSYVVELRRDLGDRLVRVASNTRIGDNSEMLVSPDAANVYIGSGFGSGSLYKLDAQQETLPLVLEDGPGDVSGTQSLTISPDGSRLLTRQGERLLSGNFSQTGIYGSKGVPFYLDPNLVGFIEDFSAEPFGPTAVVATYRAHTLSPKGRRYSGCSVQEPLRQRVEALVTALDSLVILSSNFVCVIPNISD